MCFIILIMSWQNSIAQNLIPNGSFEQYTSCPSGPSQVDSSLFWMNPSTGFPFGTPDYFNSCATSFVFSVPNNGGGFQNAHSGNAYMGMVLYHMNSANAREFIETPFSSPLVANQIYHFEMYVNVIDLAAKTTDAIAVYFSDTAITGFNNQLPLPFTPQISNVGGNYFNSNSWTLVSGDYTAHGGENYLTIGNFKYDSLTSTLPNNTSGNQVSVAFALVDDISLTLITGIDNQSEIESINVFPNPFNDKIEITANNYEPLDISLYDIAGRKLLQKRFTNSVLLNTNKLENGIYIFEVRSRSGVCKKGLLVKD